MLKKIWNYIKPVPKEVEKPKCFNVRKGKISLIDINNNTHTITLHGHVYPDNVFMLINRDLVLQFLNSTRFIEEDNGNIYNLTLTEYIKIEIVNQYRDSKDNIIMEDETEVFEFINL